MNLLTSTNQINSITVFHHECFCYVSNAGNKLNSYIKGITQTQEFCTRENEHKDKQYLNPCAYDGFKPIFTENKGSCTYLCVASKIYKCKPKR